MVGVCGKFVCGLRVWDIIITNTFATQRFRSMMNKLMIHSCTCVKVRDLNVRVNMRIFVRVYVRLISCPFHTYVLAVSKT